MVNSGIFKGFFSNQNLSNISNRLFYMIVSGISNHSEDKKLTNPAWIKLQKTVLKYGITVFFKKKWSCSTFLSQEGVHFYFSGRFNWKPRWDLGELNCFNSFQRLVTAIGNFIRPLSFSIFGAFLISKYLISIAEILCQNLWSVPLPKIFAAGNFFAPPSPRKSGENIF